MNHSDAAAKPKYMRLLRELVQAYQAFEAYTMPHIKSWGLTPAQFDVIATLGNTEGMTFRELGERTLIYKTTLTSVVDRLQERGLVERRPSTTDRRSTLAVLTPEGDALFQEAFNDHAEHLRRRLERLSEDEMEEAITQLRRVKDTFS
ncbi:MarR family transcriptional regulator [Aquisalimonas sp. 2447]|uniref:MarR family winged helix-turn-helix transcriptional regulator n=1 Tax=Aquisalimonas sp. 2447 TaxID=2740807 RepID=UPI0014326B20|nr:MarR family transcriptional regulator [Aquisalimonas sp. 2447]QIT55369.1 MarR family transcriptional regulator [Aquisalimonas sp. 2447]